MGDVLAKAADTRKLALGLKHVEYGGELVSQLMDNSQKHEKLHGKFHALLSRSGEGENEGALIKLMQAAEDHSKFYEKAKAWVNKIYTVWYD